MEWLAAEYSSGLIRVWAAERGWPELSDTTLSYYRKQYRREITAARKRRRNSALSRGLAVKEERVAQLNEVADELKAILWQEDNFGKMPNVTVWLKTLDDIAKEVGGRIHKQEITGKDGGSLSIAIKPVNYRQAVSGLAPVGGDETDEAITGEAEEENEEDEGE